MFGPEIGTTIGRELANSGAVGEGFIQLHLDAVVCAFVVVFFLFLFC